MKTASFIFSITLLPLLSLTGCQSSDPSVAPAPTVTVTETQTLERTVTQTSTVCLEALDKGEELYELAGSGWEMFGDHLEGDQAYLVDGTMGAIEYSENISDLTPEVSDIRQDIEATLNEYATLRSACEELA